MILFSFASAIREALKSGVPCNLPYSNINLLQLIRAGHARTNYGFVLFHDTHVLINPGNPVDTLQACFKENEEVLQKLNDLAKGETDIMPADVKLNFACQASLPTDLLGSDWLAADLFNKGFELDVNQTWDLSIDRKVKKRVVAVTQLEQILNHVRIGWFSPHVIGVVTAVYFITGGLSYTGEVMAVAKGRSVLEDHPSNTKADENKAELKAQTSNTNAVEGEAELEAHPTETKADTTHASVASTPGWKVTMNGTNKIVLTETDPTTWVVAIEYLKLEAHEVDGGPWLELTTDDEVMRLPPL